MRHAAFLVATGATACAPEDRSPEVPPVTWFGEHLEYAPQDGAPEPCAGTLPYMDRFVELATDAMGIEIHEPLVFVHGDDARAMCDGESVSGCVFQDVIFARDVPQEHELVHGARARYGFSSPFFEEGTAEMLGDDMYMPMRTPAHGDVVEGMILGSDRKLPSEWYPRAGHFAAFLHDEYGPEVTTALLEKTDLDSTGGMAVTVIEQTTGLALAQILEDYATEPTCKQRQYRYPLHACTQPTELWARCESGEAVELEVRLACDDPATLGPRAHDGMFRYLTVEVERDGLYTITAFDHNQVFVPFSIKECALGCDSILAGNGNVDDVHPVFLRSGRYALKLSRFPEYPTDVAVEVEGVGCR